MLAIGGQPPGQAPISERGQRGAGGVNCAAETATTQRRRLSRGMGFSECNRQITGPLFNLLRGEATPRGRNRCGMLRSGAIASKCRHRNADLTPNSPRISPPHMATPVAEAAALACVTAAPGYDGPPIPPVRWGGALSAVKPSWNSCAQQPDKIISIFVVRFASRWL